MKVHSAAWYLSRRFRQIRGATAAQWAEQRHLDTARRLLEETGMPVAQIAEAVGFSSVVTFRQSFAAAFATRSQS